LIFKGSGLGLEEKGDNQDNNCGIGLFFIGNHLLNLTILHP
jgi:hypothetical protein